MEEEEEQIALDSMISAQTMLEKKEQGLLTGIVIGFTHLYQHFLLFLKLRVVAHVQ
jgi:hypothetical protein